MSVPISNLTNLSGWFQVGWSQTVAPGELVALTVLGEEMVARRTTSGALVVTDAHCPHLGAHLAMGRAVGDGVRCPLHGWEWGADGSNTKIPYSGDTAVSVRLRVWPSREVVGLLFVWIGREGVAPTHEPFIPGGIFDAQLRNDALVGGSLTGITQFGPMTVHPQLAIEDRVDVDHFVGPHGTAPPTLDDLTFDGHYFSTTVTLGGASDLPESRPLADVLSTATGVGISCLRIRAPAFTAWIVLSITPKDDRTSDVFHTLWVEPQRGTADEALLQRVLAMMRGQLEQDLAIWSRMRHVSLPDDPAAAQPALAAVRAWARQFYSDGNDVS